MCTSCCRCCIPAYAHPPFAAVWAHPLYITYGIYRPLRNLEISTAISTFDVCADSGFQRHDTEPVMMVKFNVKSETLNFAAHHFSDTDTDFVHISVMDTETSACLLFVVCSVIIPRLREHGRRRSHSANSYPKIGPSESVTLHTVPTM